MPEAQGEAAEREGAILSVDTSLPTLSVALLLAGQALGGVTLAGRESRNEKLLPAIDWLLSEAGLPRDAIGLLVVTRGPGSFTGVRVALATVQGLSFALGAPVIAMSTHEAFAETEAGGTTTLLIHGDAGRGERYVSGFHNDRETLPPVLMKREALDDLMDRYQLSIDIDRALETVNVAHLAARRASRIVSAGDIALYRDVTPIYVRLAEAEVRLREREDGRAGERN